MEFRSAQTGADPFEIVELAATIRSDAFMGRIFQHIDDGSGDAVGRFLTRRRSLLTELATLLRYVQTKAPLEMPR